MVLKVYWTNFAKSELRNILIYYEREVNLELAERIGEGIRSCPFILKTHPEIGQIEQILTERNREYRYLVYSNYKIIYWLNKEKNRIEIMDIFATKQSPIKMKRIRQKQESLLLTKNILNAG